MIQSKEQQQEKRKKKKNQKKKRNQKKMQNTTQLQLSPEEHPTHHVTYLEMDLPPEHGKTTSQSHEDNIYSHVSCSGVDILLVSLQTEHRS